MTIDISPGLIIQTILTGVIGWAVKMILDSFKAYRDESKQWRSDLDTKIDNINDATQATMRTTILHYCEKYLTRGWVTSEELDSLLDMHRKYAAITLENGFIDTYIERVKRLDVHEI